MSETSGANSESIQETTNWPLQVDKQNRIVLPKQLAENWPDYPEFLEKYLNDLQTLCQSVGSIWLESSNPGQKKLLGTVWVIDEGICATARHVIEQYKSHEYCIYFGDKRCLIKNVAIASTQDIALLKTDVSDLIPINLDSTTSCKNLTIVAIGFPCFDTREPRKQEMIRLFPKSHVKYITPGKIIEHRDMLLHMANTLGGSSGSPLINLETKKVVGLHISGSNKSNEAIPASVVNKQFAELQSFLKAPQISIVANEDKNFQVLNQIVLTMLLPQKTPNLSNPQATNEPQNLAVVVLGAPGAGKSTLAKKCFNADVIISDVATGTKKSKPISPDPNIPLIIYDLPGNIRAKKCSLEKKLLQS